MFKCGDYVLVDGTKRGFIEQIHEQPNVSFCVFYVIENNACGVMISAIGDLLLQDLPLNFRLSDVPYYRRRTTLSILDQEHPFSPVVPIS